MSNDSPKPKGKSTEDLPPAAKAKNSNTEKDLWDLDDETTPESKEPETKSEPISLPSKRVKKSAIVTRKPVERQLDTPVAEVTEADEDTNDLEKPPHDPKDSQESIVSETKETEEVGETASTESKKEPDDIEEEASSLSLEREPDTNDSRNEPEPAVDPDVQVSTEQKLSVPSLSKIERIGVFSLLAVLAISATLAIIHFSNQMDVKPLIAEELDLPVKGKMAMVTSVETYWREPITTGENADVVKRGVELIPVIKMDLERNSSKPGAIRILFRNDENTVVGDNISRVIPSNGTLEIGATDGFRDMGMHAAYRTGSSSHWTVQVLEGPSVRAPVEQFSTLFETEVSTDMK